MPGNSLQATLVPGWGQLAPLSWTGKKLGYWVRDSAPVFTTLEVTGLLERQPFIPVNGMLILASLGFLPGLDENMEGVVVVITGIKRAIS